MQFRTGWSLGIKAHIKTTTTPLLSTAVTVKDVYTRALDYEMAYAATEENKSSGITSSDVSLQPHTKNRRSSASYPFIKPTMSAQPQQKIIEIIKEFGTVCNQWFKIPSTKCTEEKDNVSLDESKDIIRELAAELDRVVQSKIFLMNEQVKNKVTKDEQEEKRYILHWAEDVENTQTKQLDEEEKQQPTPEHLSDKENKFNKAKKILSDWSWRLKERKQNSVCPNYECQEALRDLHKHWKQGQSSMLPVMDWMIWTVLQSENCEDSVGRKWVKTKQRLRNTGGLHIPKPAWNWITKSTAHVILDPNTANPNLIVSDNGKSLRAREYTQYDNQSFMIINDQFNGWTCVQATEGYNSGRHYWEVDVRKKHEWRVGVVKESAPRHGFVTMNTKKGYWNLRLQLGTIIALTESVTKLDLPTPSKIGVFLDVEEGHVSFYDAEKRRHLYTFNADFDQTEKLYPVFGTVETDKELVIS